MTLKVFIGIREPEGLTVYLYNAPDFYQWGGHVDWLPQAVKRQGFNLLPHHPVFEGRKFECGANLDGAIELSSAMALQFEKPTTDMAAAILGSVIMLLPVDTHWVVTEREIRAALAV